MLISCHWPFTPENNAKGIIFGDQIVQAIVDSGAGQDILLAFELRCSAFYPQENAFIENLTESVAYWRQYVMQ